jgi:hypothetical protein
MLEKLQQIDTSAIEKLVNIKKEQDHLNGYLDKAEDLKEKVDEIVYQRVRDDYQNRHRELEKEADPLKAEARQEFKKLSVLFDQLTAAFEEARANKQEIEFRHSVGELSDEQHAERLKEAEQVLERCKQDVAEANQLKDRFFEAFHSKEELESESAPAEPTPAPESVPEPVSLDATMITPAGDPNAMVHTGEPPSTETAEPQSQDFSATVVVRSARLTVEEGGLEFPLGPFNEIGRGAENQIQLKHAGVSKKHALVAATPEGYAVKDLNSRYGIFVNDKQITECNLSDGDRLRIGEVNLLFHES